MRVKKMISRIEIQPKVLRALTETLCFVSLNFIFLQVK